MDYFKIKNNLINMSGFKYIKKPDIFKIESLKQDSTSIAIDSFSKYLSILTKCIDEEGFEAKGVKRHVSDLEYSIRKIENDSVQKSSLDFCRLLKPSDFHNGIVHNMFKLKVFDLYGELVINSVITSEKIAIMNRTEFFSSKGIVSLTDLCLNKLLDEFYNKDCSPQYRIALLDESGFFKTNFYNNNTKLDFFNTIALIIGINSTDCQKYANAIGKSSSSKYSEMMEHKKEAQLFFSNLA